MKVISFSLYGNNPKYTIGAIKNSQLKEKFYPGWEMRIYHNDSVPEEILKELESNDVKLINTKTEQGVCNAMWRFAPASEQEVECFISRDCDSRLFERDIAAVNIERQQAMQNTLAYRKKLGITGTGVSKPPKKIT